MSSTQSASVWGNLPGQGAGLRLPQTIERTVLNAHGVFVWTDAATAARTTVRFLDGTYPLERLPGTAMAPDDLAFRMRLPVRPGQVRATRLDGGQPVKVNPVMNALGDWMLPGGETLQISIDEHDAPARIDLGPPVQIPAHAGPLLFQALIAGHRAEAELVLDIEGPGGRIEKAVPLEPSCRGGTRAEGYQTVRLTLPPAAAPERLHLSFRFLGRSLAHEANAPFLFMTAAQVSAPEASAAAAAAVDHYGDPVEGADCWFSPLALGGLQRGDAVELATPEGEVVLLRGQAVSVDLIADQGATLVLRASRAQEYTFHLDGKEVLRAEIGTGPTAIRLPASACTGGLRLLAVKDIWGLQTFAETYVTPPALTPPYEFYQRHTRAPYPGPLAAAAGHRYQALKAHLAAGGDPAVTAQIGVALAALEAGPEAAARLPLAFPQVADPEVSVIIPAHNQIGHTYCCLAALLLAWNRASFEVILVDDASTDATAGIETLVSGITVLRNAEPQRFIRACNAGVAAARGRYVALLNNDTEPTTGWLDALLAAFGRFDRVGLAGSKLLFPDGRLQEAGGLVWRSGNPANVGRGHNPWDPRFCYARQADYLSGAALMLPRTVWDAVGGLSAYLEPMYFEDTDLAFKVRAAGLSTWFVPQSVVYHHEGGTSGTDTSTGFKRFQEINRPKFRRRWAEACAGFGPETADPDLEKDRGIVGRVLFVDTAGPRPDRDAGSYAAVQEMRLVQSLGYKVTFAAQDLLHFGAYTDELEAMGIEVARAPFVPSLEALIARRGREFDAVYVTRWNVARQVLPRLRQGAPQAKVLLNTADLHFLRILRAARAQGDAGLMAQAEATRTAELAAVTAADVVLSYNAAEHAVIESHTDGAARVVTAPWVVSLPASVPDFEARAGVSFLGGFKHHPNAEALGWYAAEVVPLLQAAAPGLLTTVYGSGMDAHIRALAAPGLAIAGFVPEVAAAYDPHRVFVAPLLSGAGIKGKVLGALAHGLPCVLSPVAAEGIGLRHGQDCLIVSTPADWAAAIRRLHEDQALWQRLSENARAYAADSFSFERGRVLMRAAFEAAGLYGSRD